MDEIQQWPQEAIQMIMEFKQEIKTLK